MDPDHHDPDSTDPADHDMAWGEDPSTGYTYGVCVICEWRTSDNPASSDYDGGVRDSRGRLHR